MDDADCDECGECYAGQCATYVSVRCHCHEECVATGARSCVLFFEDRPVCGGFCSDDPPEGDLPCGETHDAAQVEPFEPDVEPVATGGVPIGRDEGDEGGGPVVDRGCACNVRAHGGGLLLLLLLGRRRRR